MTQSRLGQTEFIALMAMLFATIAFSIDAMLPALPQIAAELSPDAPNRAQLIITSFVLGMGIGTFFVGPLSDTFGRKPVILCGAVAYCLAALVAWAAPSLETMLASRLLMGIGVAGPRIVSMAMMRDLYSGRQMAKVVSFTMMVFTLVPAIAPAFGTVIIAGFGWRSLFLAFVLFSGTASLWLLLRQPETLPPEARRPLAIAPLWQALREVLSHPVIRLAIAVQTLAFGALFATLSSTQQIFDQTYGRGDSFPFWFALIAVLSGLASFLNAKVVVRLGMRRLVSGTLAVQVALSLGMAVMTGLGLWPDALAFPAYILWTTGVFAMAGLTIGNLNAIALEPVGHIAGMAASVTLAIATVGSVILAIPLGQAFDGTVVPLCLGVAGCAALGYLLMRRMGAEKPAPRAA